MVLSEARPDVERDLDLDDCLLRVDEAEFLALIRSIVASMHCPLNRL